ncbi:ABC-2 transporter permease [Gephyromycinifex aptenodytis]|uniref:ABC-2 transporter permease n=1 Tax=Gephyromycinifex aptenodytis TaxID=2716227 RepID=UPI001445466F|nr:ABC-2 transporter permease [Gephyromycinifex aptenodytis]
MSALRRTLILDLRVLAPTHLAFGALFLATFAVAAWVGAPYLPLVAAALWASTSISGFFAIRDRDRLDLLYATLGITRREAVSSRYLAVFGVLLLLAGAFAALAVWLTATGQPSGVPMARMGVGFMVVLLGYAALQLAVAFRAPSNLAGPLTAVLVIVLLVLPVGALGLGADANTTLFTLAGTLNPVSVTVGVVAALGYAASWLSTQQAMTTTDL